MIHFWIRLGVMCTLVAAPGLFATTLTFEGLADQQEVNDFYPGVHFTNALALVAGESLNDQEVPPESGETVAVNEGDPISIVWDNPATNFSAFFTYTNPLTLHFFLNGVQVGNDISSSFDDNLASSGNPPDELISFSGLAFDSVRIDVADEGQYAVDDVSYDTAGTSTVPEPGTMILVLGAVGVAAAVRRRVKAA